MKVFGITKVRNESMIMQETLDHWAKICTGGIYVYDDVSDDNTVEICENHPAVKAVVKGEYWDSDRERAEWMNRQAILRRGQRDASKEDWFVYFDADERLYFDAWDVLFRKDIDVVACKLYDVYITPEDENKPYLDRNWIGPEYRTIVMFFRNDDWIGYDKPDQRIVNLKPDAYVAVAGVIKHFGKGLSVDHWNQTCRYYIDHWPKYEAKWRQRLGKAVKKDYKSDFGNELIKFNDVLSGREEGFSLEAQTYGSN